MIKRFHAWGEQHEILLSGVLIGIALVLVCIAIFGKTEHKIGAALFIVL